MFSKQMIISWIVVFISMMFYGFIVFGIALDSFYTEHTANLTFRVKGEELMQWLALGQLIMAYAFVWIWSHAVSGKGIKEGLRFGFFMGIFWAGVEMIQFAFVPMEPILMWVGYVADVVMMMFSGVVLSFVWKKISNE